MQLQRLRYCDELIFSAQIALIMWRNYYKKLTVAREARNKLSEDVKVLDELLVRYKEEVQVIKNSLSGGSNE